MVDNDTAPISQITDMDEIKEKSNKAYQKRNL